MSTQQSPHSTRLINLFKSSYIPELPEAERPPPGFPAKPQYRRPCDIAWPAIVLEFDRGAQAINIKRPRYSLLNHPRQVPNPYGSVGERRIYQVNTGEKVNLRQVPNPYGSIGERRIYQVNTGEKVNPRQVPNPYGSVGERRIYQVNTGEKVNPRQVPHPYGSVGERRNYQVNTGGQVNPVMIMRPSPDSERALAWGQKLKTTDLCNRRAVLSIDEYPQVNNGRQGNPTMHVRTSQHRALSQDDGRSTQDVMRETRPLLASPSTFDLRQRYYNRRNNACILPDGIWAPKPRRKEICRVLMAQQE